MCLIRELETGKVQRLDPVLLKRINQRQTKNGKPYCALTLTDGVFEIIANLWDAKAEDVKVPVKSCIVADIECSEYMGNKTYAIRAYGPSDADPEQFEKHAPAAATQMYNYLLGIAATIEANDLRCVTTHLLEANMDRLLSQFGAVKVHHAYKGGLLFHICNICYEVENICKVYPVLNRDLLKAGAILHDIGKVRELDEDENGANITFEGGVISHSIIGVTMVEDTVRELNAPMTENIKLLENIIASHLLKEEYGMAAQPFTREAYMIGMLDEIDRRMDIYDTTLKTMEPGEISAPVQYLDYRRVYKPTTAV